MADPRGRSATWTAAALAGPVVAGLFAGATAWATHVDPLHPDGPTVEANSVGSAPSPSSPTEDPALAALRKSLAANQAQVNALAKRVAAVRRQATALSRGTGAGGAGSGSGSSAGSGSSSSSAGTRSTASTSARSTSRSSGSTSAPAPAPAPPPPTHGSTGASGTG